ncbi:MAG: uncharacterized protein JWR45_2780, partial [Blastococcus sp.]|nr:uncharacterized protein [Blastococcus sp.]
ARSWESAPTDPRRWDAPPPPAAPATSTFAAAGPPPQTYSRPAYSPPAQQPPHDRWSALTDPAFTESPLRAAEETSGSARSRHAVDQPAPPPTVLTPVSRPPVVPAEPPPSPLDWLAARSLLDPPAPGSRHEVPMALRPEVPPRPALRPEVPPPVPGDTHGGYRVAARGSELPPARPEPTTQGTRVADILAENGVTPPSGGRRRRRYRDDDDTDDVLARVLRQN